MGTIRKLRIAVKDGKVRDSGGAILMGRSKGQAAVR
jgi:hypothetical protein